MYTAIPYLIQLLLTCTYSPTCAQYKQPDCAENTVSYRVNDAAMVPQSHPEFRSGTKFSRKADIEVFGIATMAAILDFKSKDRNRDGLTIDYNYNSQCNVDSCNFKSRIYLYVLGAQTGCSSGTGKLSNGTYLHGEAIIICFLPALNHRCPSPYSSPHHDPTLQLSVPTGPIPRHVFPSTSEVDHSSS